MAVYLTVKKLFGVRTEKVGISLVRYIGLQVGPRSTVSAPQLRKCTLSSRLLITTRKLNGANIYLN